MARVRIYRPGRDGDQAEEWTDLGSLSDLLNDEQVVWVVIEEPSREELSALPAVLGLHPLAADDLDEDGNRPRIRLDRDRLSMVLMSVLDGQEDVRPRFVRVNAFTAPNRLVTVSRERLPVLHEAASLWLSGAANLPEKVSGPLYVLLDTLMDGYFGVMDGIADRLDDLEDDVIQGHSHEALTRLFVMKKSLVHFRRVTSGTRDVANTLLRFDEMFGGDAVPFFQDAYDHAVRTTETLDAQHELLSNAMDAYLSVTSNQMAESANRLNGVMQTLTAWSIILGAGTFIAGIYGMNVEGLPLASRPGAFLAVCGVCLAVASVLFAFFRRRRWV